MSILKNIGYSSIQSIGSLILNFFISILVARILQPYKLGEYSFVLWLITFVSTFALLGLPLTLTRYIAQYYPHEKLKIKKFIFFNTKYFLLFLLFLLVVIRFLYFNKLPINFFILVFILLLYIINSLFSSILSGLQNFKVLMWSTISSQFVQLVFVIILLSKYPLVKTMVTIYTVCLLVSIIVTLTDKRIFDIIKFEKIDSWIENKNVNDYFKTVSILLVLDYVVWQNSEIFFLRFYSPVEEIGFYTLAFSLGYFFSKVVNSCLGRVFFPFMSNIYGLGDYDKLKEVYYSYTKYISMVLIPIYIFLFFYVGNLIEFLYGSHYVKVAKVARIIFVSALIGGIVSPGSLYFHTIERVNTMIRIGCFTSVLNILLNFLLIPKYHSTGAAFGNMFAQIVGCVIGTGYYILYRFKLRFPWFYLLKYFVISIVLTILLRQFCNSNKIFWLIILFVGYLFLYFLLILISPKERLSLKKFLLTKV